MKILITLYSVLFALISFAQDINFNQVNLANMYFNPALTGMNGERKISTVFRHQWPSSTASIRSTFVSYQDGSNSFGNLGIYYMNDYYMNGTLNSNRISLCYAKPIKIIGNLAITPGISGTFIYDRIDFSKMTFDDAENPRIVDMYDILFKERHFSGTFSSGFLITWKNVFAGVGLNQFGTIGANYTFNTYSNIGISLSHKEHDLLVIPEISLNTMQESYNAAVKVSSIYKWGKIGIEYNLRNGFSAIAGVQLANFDLAISTEWTNSESSDFNDVYFEIGCTYTFKKQGKNKPLYNYSLF